MAEQKKQAKVDKNKFVERKLSVLNVVGTPKANRAMMRVIANNKEEK